MSFHLLSALFRRKPRRVSRDRGPARVRDGFHPFIEQLEDRTVPSFTAGPSLTVGQNPSSIAVGDFNGDGLSDIVTVNNFSSNISVLLNQGGGTFAAASNTSISGFAPSVVVVGDFNGDSKLDIVVLGSNMGAILLGNGNGTFGSPTPFTAAASGGAIGGAVVGDFNGDNKLDIAVTDLAHNQVDVVTGTGSGTFGTPSPFTVGTTPLGIVAADFNGDNKLDLATTNNGGSNVSVLVNSSSGGVLNFAMLRPWPSPAPPVPKGSRPATSTRTTSPTW